MWRRKPRRADRPSSTSRPNGPFLCPSSPVTACSPAPPSPWCCSPCSPDDMAPRSMPAGACCGGGAALRAKSRVTPPCGGTLAGGGSQERSPAWTMGSGGGQSGGASARACGRTGAVLLCWRCVLKVAGFLARQVQATAGSLRRQPFGHPAAAFPAVADPVVQAVRRFLPELHAGGQHPEAAPALRAGNIGSAGVAPQHVLDLHFQDRPAGDDAA